MFKCHAKLNLVSYNLRDPDLASMCSICVKEIKERSKFFFFFFNSIILFERQLFAW